MVEIKLFNLKELLYQDSADILNIMGTTGRMGIMGGHIPMVVDLGIGPHYYQKGDEKLYFYTNQGMAYIEKDLVKIFAVKLVAGKTMIKDPIEQLNMKIILGKIYNYDEIKKNIIRNMKEQQWGKGKNI